MGAVLDEELRLCLGMIRPETDADKIAFLETRIRVLRERLKVEEQRNIKYVKVEKVIYREKYKPCNRHHIEPIGRANLAAKAVSYARGYMKEADRTDDFMAVALKEAYESGARSWHK